MPARPNPNPAFLTDVTAAFRSVLQCPDLELTAATSLEDIPGWDSMDLIAIIVELEYRHDILFGLPEIDALHTIGDMVRALAAKRSMETA